MNSPFRKVAIAALLAAAAMITNQASAIPISGEITFGGAQPTLANSSGGAVTDATQATQISSFGAYDIVTGGSGSYSSVPASFPTNTLVAFTPFSFTASDVVPLWQFTVAGLPGITYSFNVSSIVNTSSSSFLNLSGTGTAFISGPGSPYDLSGTDGTWSLTASTSGSVFSFGATTTVPTTVPDNGATIILIGMGLLGIALTARRMKEAVVKA